MTDSLVPDDEELAQFRAWQTRNASPEAVAMAEAGAAPTSVDTAELLRQMEEMQARLDSLSAAQGIPSDPIAAQVQALSDHVKAHAAAHPSYDFSELQGVLSNLPDSKSLTTDHTALLQAMVEDHVRRFGGIAHDLAYLWQLAGDLHRMLLKKNVQAV